MNHRERMELCLSGNQPDRTPVALWRHFPVDDQKADTMAAAHLNFHNTFDFDFIKVTPASGYFLYDWGLTDTWQGHPHGTRTYLNRIIHRPEQWTELKPLDPHQGHLGEQLSALNKIIQTIGPDTPVIHTIFNPLSQAKKLAGDDVFLSHLREYPDEVHRGLETITETTKDFISAVIYETGADGIFYAVQHARRGQLTQDEYFEFGRTYDLPLLQSAAEGWLNILHLHGENIYFDDFMDYPVQVINWHDMETKPDLRTGLEKFPGIVCGGMRQEMTVNLGTADQVEAEARAAINVTGGKRFILGTGCVAPTTTPYGNLIAARQIVER